MKIITALSMILALSTSGLALAQDSSMGDMNMKEKGMGMKEHGMDSKEKGMGMEKGMDMKSDSNATNATVHQATGVVKAVDAANGKVTLAHDPIQSLKWPAMTMDFAIEDKALIKSFSVGKKVNVELTQKGSDYVITSVK